MARSCELVGRCAAQAAVHRLKTAPRTSKHRNERRVRRLLFPCKIHRGMPESDLRAVGLLICGGVTPAMTRGRTGHQL